jgi:membrane protein
MSKMAIADAEHTLVRLLQTSWAEFERDHARYFAAAMVYYLLVSVVPLLLLLLAGLGLMLRFSAYAVVAEQQVLLAIETSLGPELRTTIEDSLEQVQAESGIAGAIGVLGLLLTASVLFRHLRLSFRAIWKHASPFVSGSPRVVVRATLIEYAIGYMMVLVGGLLLILALALTSVTQWVGGLLVALPPFDRAPAWLLALPGSVIIVWVTFALLLKYLPPVRLRWRHVWLAAALCTTAWAIGAEMLVLIGAMVRNQPTAYGAMGGLLAALLWANVVSQLLFYGAELCKVVWARDEAPSFVEPL